MEEEHSQNSKARNKWRKGKIYRERKNKLLKYGIEKKNKENKKARMKNCVD